MRWWIYLSHIFELWDEEIHYAEKIITILLNTQLMQFCKERLRNFTVFISTSHSSNIWNCSFCNFVIFAITLRSSLRRGKNRSTQRKTSWSKRENQQQTQPTYIIDTRIQTQATLVGGKCFTISPLLLHIFIISYCLHDNHQERKVLLALTKLILSFLP